MMLHVRKDLSFLWNQPFQTFTEPGCEDCGDEERLDQHRKEHSDFRLVCTSLKFLLIRAIFLKLVLNLFFYCFKINLSAFYLFNLACFSLAERSEKQRTPSEATVLMPVLAFLQRLFVFTSKPEAAFLLNTNMNMLK